MSYPATPQTHTHAAAPSPYAQFTIPAHQSPRDVHMAYADLRQALRPSTGPRKQQGAQGSGRSSAA
ncbi:hypothetical protein PLICRDRAFT_44354 [Plicaturopsis crispa FD-325 SS-3]|nr:hypothetical protein PLICRDRAFT_44354 [Plicaturopsis crispa FD-325 SS-3]